MLYQSHEHFYLDGDLIISVGGTAFRVHKVIMGLSSQVFQELISRSTTAINGITAIVLDENNSENFKILLSFIYPIGHISISWDNIYELLRLSEKYKMKSPFEASKEFLEKEFFQDPLISLYLAEVYQLDQLYVESSKLILDELNDFRITHNFKLISLNTREKLLDRYMDYIFSLNLLSKDIFISNYKHTCSNPQIHQIELIKSIEELIKKVQIYPTLKPSITKKILCPKFNNYYYNNNNDIDRTK
ncbi:BTB/POZ domain-containing protein [Glomus cerebriforme]|uniref:BTB/POZ domain-containing protein n=1 Tax=Glomus cerebriforme TaxID=658196 RepID=A0A397STX3_9GLOM|nr:BTB/POZ domain-containing protein [Glomus cerebriforme]